MLASRSERLIRDFFLTPVPGFSVVLFDARRDGPSAVLAADPFLSWSGQCDVDVDALPDLICRGTVIGWGLNLDVLRSSARSV